MGSVNSVSTLSSKRSQVESSVHVTELLRLCEMQSGRKHRHTMGTDLSACGVGVRGCLLPVLDSTTLHTPSSISLPA